jgi:predicted GNAT superfamily acetyltransferase
VIAIRKLSRIGEFEEAVAVQAEVWGFDPLNLVPGQFFVVADIVGGQVLGAFEGSRMIGFLLSVPGLKPGNRGFLHSHMLAVLPPYRNQGIGRLLKLAQREDALARGIDLVEWTFDPLELKNAFFNIEKLGAIARRYVVNQYGMTTSHLHSGLPTDRLVAEWWVARAGEAREAQVEARVEVPCEIAGLRRSDPERAREIQRRIGAEFEELFGRGLAVVRFERSEDKGTYLLGRWQ